MDLCIISIGAAILYIGWIIYEALAAPDVDENDIKIKKDRKEENESSSVCRCPE